MQGFNFKHPVDPKNPLDPNDPPPKGWESVDTSDFRGALFGFPSDNMERCADWEKRELKRYKDIPEFIAAEKEHTEKIKLEIIEKLMNSEYDNLGALEQGLEDLVRDIKWQEMDGLVAPNFKLSEKKVPQ